MLKSHWVDCYEPISCVMHARKKKTRRDCWTLNRDEFRKLRRRRLDVPAGIGVSGSSSVVPRCPVGGPLSRPRHTIPTILPHCICLHRENTYTWARTHKHTHTYIHVRSTREENINLALYRQGGQRIPFKDHVSRTAVSWLRASQGGRRSRSLWLASSVLRVRGTNSREIDDSSLRRRKRSKARRSVSARSDDRALIVHLLCIWEIIHSFLG